MSGDWGEWSANVADAPLSSSESQGIWGFTESDWFSDVKQVANLWGYVENKGQMQNAGQNQSDLMYTVPVQTRPNAQYSDPTPVPIGAVAGINKTYVIAGVGLVALAYLVLK